MSMLAHNAGGRLHRAEEVAERWRVSPRTVYRLAETGALPSVRIGGSIRFESEALERYVAQRRRCEGRDA